MFVPNGTNTKSTRVVENTEMANRSNDIVEKLAYAQLRLVALQRELADVQASEGSISFIGQKVGEILGACRECFDYAAKDLVDAFFTKKPKQIYFPFSQESLVGGALSQLSEAAPGVYEFLIDVADRIKKKSAWPGTIFGYAQVSDVNDLVNSKKHDRITVAQRRENAATRVQFPSGATVLCSPVYSFDGAIPNFGEGRDAESMVGSHPDVSVTYVSEYRLAENNWEIARYCNHSIEVCWRLLDELYRVACLQNEAATFSPHETLKPADQRVFEELLARAEHIVTRLIRVGFLQRGSTVRMIEMEFDGRLNSSDKDDLYLGSLFIDIFNSFGWESIVRPKLEPVIFQHLANVEAAGFGPRYCEVAIEQSATLELPSGTKLEFDSLIWGLGTKFQQPDSQSLAVQLVTSEQRARVSLVFPNSQFYFAVGTVPLGR